MKVKPLPGSAVERIRARLAAAQAEAQRRARLLVVRELQAIVWGSGLASLLDEVERKHQDVVWCVPKASGVAPAIPQVVAVAHQTPAGQTFHPPPIPVPGTVVAADEGAQGLQADRLFAIERRLQKLEGWLPVLDHFFGPVQ